MNMSKNQYVFDESKFKIRSRSILGKPEVPSIIKFLIIKKIIKKEKYALMLIFSFIVLSISLSALLINKSITVYPAIIDPRLMTSNK